MSFFEVSFLSILIWSKSFFFFFGYCFSRKLRFDAFLIGLIWELLYRISFQGFGSGKLEKKLGFIQVKLITRDLLMSYFFLQKGKKIEFWIVGFAWSGLLFVENFTYFCNVRVLLYGVQSINCWVSNCTDRTKHCDNVWVYLILLHVH